MKHIILQIGLMVMLVSCGEKQHQERLVFKSSQSDGIQKVIWTGDLDRDDQPDLLIDTSDHYNVFQPTLFLSSKADSGVWVKAVAYHTSVGC